MPRIFDNIDLELRPALIETLERSYALDTCVGYFNLRGWSSLSTVVDSLPHNISRSPVRILIGMQDRPGSRLRDLLRINGRDSSIDNAHAIELLEASAAEFREQLTWGIPSYADERTLRALKRQLKDGQVQIKLFLRDRLHAKLYLCYRADPVNPRVGFVGSSNLTFPGLSGQGELNIDVLDHDATEKLSTWFAGRWDDHFSLDITDKLVEILDESWASDRAVSPYLIHLKIAFHLSRDARAGLIEYGLPASMQEKLLEYQSAAVRITARNLLARKGALLGDVVGLGKTIVATAVALTLQEEHGYETLIICPKNLVEMWESYVSTYRLHARVISLSMVDKELKELRRYRLLVIDESHNLRNPKRIDYAAIRDYISINDPHVLLLTATPFNTSMSDVAGQIGLFVDEDQDLGIRPEAAIAKMGEFDFLRRCDDKPATLRAFSLSEEAEDWQKLLSQFLIRRTRKFIRDNYAVLDESINRYFLLFGDGTKQYLPDRVPLPLTFKASSTDPASDMVSDRTLSAIDRLLLPRYALSRYVKDNGPAPLLEEKQLLAKISRAGGNLLGFTRTMLMKRLSSSGAVFILSLKRHLLRNYIYAHAIRLGKSIPIGRVDDSQILGNDTSEIFEFQLGGESEGAIPPSNPSQQHLEMMAGSSFDLLVATNPSGLTWVRSSLFSDSLLQAIQHDNEILEGLLASFGDWDHSADSKLDALEELLTTTHPDEKVLIFSEYADTTEYLLEGLQLRGIERVAAVTGDSENPTQLARRFSPRSNTEIRGPQIKENEELRVLIATDVLSEGQNLQDAAIVINFDLPWAIIKLIQRAGRVDRIGQTAEKVLIYTFLPSEGVEAILRLRSRVAQRLAQNAAVFGSDERFLNTPGEEMTIRKLFNEDAEFPEGDEVDQVDYASAAYEIWRSAETKTPQLAAAAVQLANVSHATQRSTTNRGLQSGVLVYTLSEFGVDRIGFGAVHAGESRRLSPMEALQMTACAPETPGLPRMQNHYDLINSVVTGPLAPEAMGPEGTLTGIRRRVYERVRSFHDSSNLLLGDHKSLSEAIDALHRMPLTEQAKQILGKATKERTSEDIAALVVALHDERRLSIDVSNQPDDIQIVCSMGFAPERETR